MVTPRKRIFIAQRLRPSPRDLPDSRRTPFCASALIAGLVAVLMLASAGSAHEIPNDVTIQAFLKPQGQTLRLLVRVPLTAMRDINFPEISGGYLDLRATSALMPDAATLWISDFVEVYEGDRKLPRPQVAATQLSLQSDRSFSSYDQALAHVKGTPLLETTTVV